MATKKSARRIDMMSEIGEDLRDDDGERCEIRPFAIVEYLGNLGKIEKPLFEGID